MNRATGAVCALVALAVGAGLGFVLVGPVAAAVLIAGAAVAVGLCVRYRTLSHAVVTASFFSRVQLPGPVPLLLEHCVTLIALPAAARRRGFFSAIASPTVVLFALFIAWNGAVSALRSPDAAASFRIVGWLSIDLLIVVIMLVAQESGDDPVAFGLKAARWVAAAALFVWLLAQLGLSDFGTQSDPLTGARALYAFSFEANILGSLMAMWLFVLFTRAEVVARRAGYWIQAALLLGVLLVSLTRAAALGLLAGVIVWQVLERSRRRHRSVLRIVVLGAVAVATVLVLSPLAPVRTRLGQLTDLGSSTGKQRTEKWATAFDDFDIEAVVVGLGTNSFGQRHLEPTLPRTPTPAYLGNLPLQVVYDSGVVGALLLLGVFVSALPRGRHSRARALGLFTVFVVASMATSALWFATTWIFLARGVNRRRLDARMPAREIALPSASVARKP